MPSTQTFEQNLELRIWLRLLACSNLVMARLRRRLHAECGLTLPVFDILAQINWRPLGPTMGELSKRLMVSKGSVTDLVERLEKRGLVMRTINRHDGRVQHVFLTAKGQKLLARVIPVHDACIGQMLSGIDRNQLADLYAALGEIKRSVRALNADAIEPIGFGKGAAA
ncbi:MAG: MarR family transcriptional regulator [Rhizobiales bacterium]|nr:MarR family transcriptional regulator [Hyphomicrobiales bacterium]